MSEPKTALSPVSAQADLLPGASLPCCSAPLIMTCHGVSLNSAGLKIRTAVKKNIGSEIFPRNLAGVPMHLRKLLNNFLVIVNALENRKCQTSWKSSSSPGKRRLVFLLPTSLWNESVSFSKSERLFHKSVTTAGCTSLKS